MGGLYDTDIPLLSEQQAGLLRRLAAGEQIYESADWQNLAEAIEAVGESQSRELASRIATVLEHLIKLQASPAIDPRNGWKSTVRNARRGIERSLKTSPSLRREVAEMIADETSAAKQDVAAVLKDYDEQPVVAIEGLTFAEEHVLGNWFPDDVPT